MAVEVNHDPPKTLLSTLANGVVVVMEMNKEREAFESVFTAEKGWDLTFINECYQNIGTFKAFAGWKSAKEHATPEGFVLMPIKPTETMVMAVAKEHEGDAFLPYSLYDAFVKQAMIEAQEQSHD